MWLFDNRTVPDVRTALPGPNGAEMLARDKLYVSPSYTPMYPLFVERGSGCVIQDVDGNLFLDFTAGIAVTNTGHCHPEVVAAIKDQAEKLLHMSGTDFYYRPQIDLAEKLAKVAPGPTPKRVFFCNSGAEGVETAIKFARARAGAAGKPGRDILAFKGGFHGRTGFALSVTYTPSYREPFEPLMPGVRFADFNDVAALATVLDQNVCAVIVEPVQGEGGVVPATKAFMTALRARCTAVGAALILDEVQCGMGRTGRLLASEYYDVKGEMVVLSKALGGGIPLAAVLMTEDVASAIKPGMHGCTFGGGAAAAAAGNWVLGQINKPSFFGKVTRAGRGLEVGLTTLVRQHASLSEARGMGLLRAIELKPDAPYTPADLVKAAMDKGLLLIRGGDRAVRLLPPLTVTPIEIGEALDKLDAALKHLEATRPLDAVRAAEAAASAQAAKGTA
jgi:4-aminobutyrate aminotransferase